MLKYALALRTIKHLVVDRAFVRPIGDGHAAEAALDLIMETVSVLDYDCDYLPGAELTQVCNDSRRAVPNSLFVAIKGSSSNGEDFVPQALQNGAVIIISENLLEDKLLPGTVNLVVKNAYWAYALLCEAFYDFPTSGMKAIALTGTNGKTTSVMLLRKLLKAAQKSCGLISTIEYDDGEAVIPADRTTPEALRLFELFDKMRSNNVQNLVMEVSSHALHQKRIGNVKYAAAIFTNLTGEHLDYHKTMEEYYQAKKRLFTDHIAVDGIAVINSDDAYGKRLAEELQDVKLITFGQHSGSWRINNVITAPGSSTFTLQGNEFEQTFTIPLSGLYNIYNTAGVVLALHFAGLLPLNESAEMLKNHHFSVPGRMESFQLANGATAVVDYAHTPDALKNILTALRELEPSLLTAVFGCGGDRDRSKRPQMGQIAAQFADKVYITSDNPRSEEPAEIIAEICSGIPENCRNICIEPDRRTAIWQALKNALPGSIVLIAGKGHEDYQEIKGVKQHFDDREVVRDFLN